MLHVLGEVAVAIAAIVIVGGVVGEIGGRLAARWMRGGW